ncbi:MAG TPA: ergothioneine biosynthesis protein EgtB [Polyangiaceae bacterium]|nr:ergothioneine biosynthesis protein EgtB [Polyangiaceae bacterium]
MLATDRHEAEALGARFLRVRATTEELCAPLSAEDSVVQSMPDASPSKWHLAHTSWFFETFVLGPLPGYQPLSAEYAYLFNSYYEALGARHPRAARGLLSRPSLEEVKAYRRHVTEGLFELLETRRGDVSDLAATIELGIQHEQQHQELILTDIKHLFGSNPVLPAYHLRAQEVSPAPPGLAWHPVAGGIRLLGHQGQGFSFDNELPRHREFLESYALGSRLVTNAEYLEFIRDRGYERPELWLSDGWRVRTERGWSAPLYWQGEAEGARAVYTLSGVVPLRAEEPVCHVSYYEADAFARWAGARLPSEAEWENAFRDVPLAGNLLDSGRFHPRAALAKDSEPTQVFGDTWEWTASAYSAYPGYRPTEGALGEYNGKFMCNQMVLRGGSCATPHDHIRPSYRNFFPPDARWQFSGLRLARSA